MHASIACRARPGAGFALAVILSTLPPDRLAAQSGPPTTAEPPPAAAVARTADAAAFTVDDLLDVASVSVEALSDDGRWLAATVSSLRDRIGTDNHRFGDPTYIAPRPAEVRIIDTRTGESRKLFPDKRQVRALSWSPDASRLALLLRRGDAFEPMVWERASGRLRAIPVPRGRETDDGAELQWTPDGTQLLIPLRAAGWRAEARARFEREVRGPVVVQSSRDPFLSWEAIRRLPLRRSLALHDLRTGQTRDILAEALIRSYELGADGSFLIVSEDITEKTDYDVIFGSVSRVRWIPLPAGEARTLIESTKGISPIWARDRRSYAYHKDGDLYFARVDDAEPRRLTGRERDAGTAAGAGDAAAADERRPTGGAAGATSPDTARERVRFTAVRLSPAGNRLVASSRQGLWLVDTATGERELFLAADEDDAQAPRRQVVDWSPDETAIYLSHASRTEWERGVLRYDVAAQRLHELVKDSRSYAGLRLSLDGGTFVFSSSQGARPNDLFATDADFRDVRRLTDANPQLAAKALAQGELVSYLDADGNKLHGVLYHPAGFERGKRYPTVFIVYEQFFDDNFNGTINVLTSNGYAVMQPSVRFEQGYPGEAWLKGVTAAANKLIDMGIADADRLGVQGISYGGYATNLLIAQTPRFKAAINISGKVNMVSFYTDSPRLGVRNIHAPEKSQDRIGATLWQQPHKYTQHSAVLFADRIRTPLLLITGEQDHNVPARQAMEMFYALRRLGKEVEWVNYVNGGHGMPTSSVDEVHDYHRRMLDWYDRFLKAGDKAVAAG